ncbi:benzoate 4-monooxygenase cytochrome P450 [Karstenula rhodostoma CBS 690.94]|uniref:Benzoate 4-monooxygenase cytochrome P450 n=1 Tax=Karstenula rhodostoma CBS 690.94 TaxID=1392251 RepID=A0A9P4UDB4_9PLEO|nr:benzoate 4-monooxygenase cytochrome P450 [Karstenula rhodostoma CBS 690.94]
MLAVTLAFASLVSYLLYSIWRLLYNVYFHPLAKFPGPWWAGATSYVEAYFDIAKGGRYFAEIEAMHARYGSIVRITPTELSIRDAEFYENIYGTMNARREIDETLAKMTTSPTSVISTVKHDHHRARRNPLLGFFSKQAITRLEPFISSRVALLVKKLKHAHETGHVIEAIDAYGALTTDVISFYAYGEAFDYLGKDTDLTFKNDYLHAISGLAFTTPLLHHFPFVADCMRHLPEWFLKTINPGMVCINELRSWCSANGLKAIEAAQSDAKNDSVRPETIFEALLSDSLPPEEKTLQRMTDEGFVIIAAGLETTARYLTNITTHLILRPDCLARLRAELKMAMPTLGDCPPSIVLENLPYLSAVVHEGLRCETIFSNRFTRKIVEPLLYKDLLIPAGNHIAEVFPEPDKFNPERWIEARERGENLVKYLATFLYMTVAMIFRNLEMELVDSGLEDITMTRGYQFGFTENYKWGTKVKITKVLE